MAGVETQGPTIHQSAATPLPDSIRQSGSSSSLRGSQKRGSQRKSRNTKQQVQETEESSSRQRGLESGPSDKANGRARNRPRRNNNGTRGQQHQNGNDNSNMRMTTTVTAEHEQAPVSEDRRDGGQEQVQERTRQRSRNRQGSGRVDGGQQRGPTSSDQSSRNRRRGGRNGNANGQQGVRQLAIPSTFGTQLTLPSLVATEADDHNHDQHAKQNIPTASLDLADYFFGLDLNANSLAVSILQEIHSGAYECMICINSITRKSRIWTCDTCYRVFHVNCIQKWAKQLKTTGAENNPTQPFESQQWRCPGCQTSRESIPQRYRCWCGKVENPDQSPLFPPHSCGQTCAAEYPNCPHGCQVPCHPGPHPKCQALGPQIDCFCGKSSSQRQCVETKYDGWSCGVECGEMMACGVHTCPRPCHTGLCGPCQAPIHSSCYCGKEDKDVKCYQSLPPKRSVFIDEDGDEAWWTGIYNCDNICGRYFDCGEHQCQKGCHPQDLKAAHCPLSPDVILTCPCTKHTVQDILGHPREKCTDAIPICNDLCSKTLPCGHSCKQVCHTGMCGPCFENVTVPCGCGYNKITLSCADLVVGSPRCNRTCRIQLNCQRHECGTTCCPAERAGQERAMKQRRKDNNIYQNLEDYIEPQHICLQTCNRLLKCGSHHCQATCHRGPCPTCLEASFDELTCHCGRTRMMPPIPCGTPPPKCSYPCNRPTSCGHPIVGHNCHLDDEECPKCPYFVERPCMCGKNVLKNQPCSRQQVSCGTICNKLVACGSHRCKKVCHCEGQCENPCSQPCNKIKSCGHPDEAPCHSPFQCEEAIPCTALIKISCPCGNLTTTVKCNATKTSKSPKRELKCNDQCAIIARNNRLAEALNINTEARTDSSLIHTELSLRLYGTNKQWCESIEKIIDSFVVGTPPKRSLAFPPMKRTQRQFIHTLAEAYNLESESQDPEPHRSVLLHRTSKTALPQRNLAQSHAIYLKTKAQEGALPASGTLPAQLRKTPKQAYNAILLESVQIGLTRVELERKIEPVIVASSQLRFSVHWIADEDVLLQPKSSSLGVEEVEAELAMLKPIVRKFVVLHERLAEVVELCWVTRDNVIAYREKSASQTSSSVPTPSASMTSLVNVGRFASLNSVAALADDSASTSPARAVKAKSKKEPEQVAESWEDLSVDEAEPEKIEDKDVIDPVKSRVDGREAAQESSPSESVQATITEDVN
ncbi:hypothetical protein POJ06DRAFT_198492 [Lipomyces tetrasporus]|uniref:R3H domain-containing protein n=1 Tax=Lipomyces tetrasporus TaxID=54092 RepID=A0AAD7QQZ1_9ASCO|nr:uncharacterized protein POJ06DRAFT_198492 [Lipomyces tetrasporus]KAJ8099675.1 hypothetical protein POJ06DRAFT_198492 [Lipomyces tetrasporus]